MITDKDMEDAESVYHTSMQVYAGSIEDSALCEMVSRIRSESTDQARKDAADRAVKFVDQFDEDAQDGDFWTSADLRNVILNSTVNEGKTDSEKLAIAVKALEEASIILSKTDGDYDALCTIRQALKEIQV